ncbi:MAG: exosortase [Thermodesulfobacteriota bacterium]|nr:exosortase [Thermodesulfobacteriota bacterium]
MPDPKPRFNRTAVSLTIGVIMAFFIAYFPVWKRLVQAWLGSEEYSHGFFVVPLSLYVLWRKKELLSEIPGSPSRWGMGVVVLSLSIYVFAHVGEILTVASFSMLLLIAGTVLYLFGLSVLKELAFPLVFLLFMIPIPSQIYSALTIPLQLFVSKASVWMAECFAIPIYREGNIIHLPGRTFEVVRACSGLRSMISLLALSAVFGYFTLTSPLFRIILFFSGIPAAILVNVIRVLLLVTAFHYFSVDFTVGSIHTIFGMCIFLLALLFILGIKGILSNWDKHFTEG